MPAEPELTVCNDTERTDPRSHLGSGTGRLADPLAIAGHDVLAVDVSQDMLDRVRHARTFRSTIEDLDIAERFDLVLLLSHLINVPVDEQRLALLRTAKRHLRPGGLVVVQRHDPSRRLQPGYANLGEVEVGLSDIVTDWPFVSAVTRYSVNNTAWTQSWRARILDDSETVEELVETTPGLGQAGGEAGPLGGTGAQLLVDRRGVVAAADSAVGFSMSLQTDLG